MEPTDKCAVETMTVLLPDFWCHVNTSRADGEADVVALLDTQISCWQTGVHEQSGDVVGTSPLTSRNGFR